MAPKTIDEYIAEFSPEIQEILQRIRVTVHEAAPGAEEKISYRIPTFTLNGNWFISRPSRIISVSILR